MSFLGCYDGAVVALVEPGYVPGLPVYPFLQLYPFKDQEADVLSSSPVRVQIRRFGKVHTFALRQFWYTCVRYRV